MWSFVALILTAATLAVGCQGNGRVDDDSSADSSEGGEAGPSTDTADGASLADADTGLRPDASDGDAENDDTCDVPRDPEGQIGPRTDYSSLEEHFVSPDGSADAPGTREAPWSAEAADDRAEPGDVVHFLSGTYEETIAPPEGEPDAPVVFRSWKRHGATLKRHEGNIYNIGLTDTKYAVVQGFRVRAGPSRMASIKNSENVRIRDVDFDGGVIGGRGGMPVRVRNASRVDFINNRVRRSRKGDLLKVSGSDRVRIIGNTFKMSPHKPMNVKYTDRLVARANVLHNPIGGQGAVFLGEKNLVEGNVWTNGFDGPGSNGVGDAMYAEHLIYRRNRSYRNWGVHQVLHLRSEGMRAKNSRYVHNVHHDSTDVGQRGAQAWHLSGGSRAEDLVFKNNAYFDVGQDQDLQQLWVSDIGDGSARFTNNFIGASGEDSPTIRYDRTSYAASRIDQQFDTFADNLIDRPEPFVEPDSYNHRPRRDGPLVDTGAPLTRTTQAGSGRTVEVDDPYYFYDGWDIQGETGDVVRIGDDVAQIRDVDYEAGELRLESAIDWESGEAVGIPWQGENPDVGARESGDSRRVFIEKLDRDVSAGDTVRFRAVVNDKHCPRDLCWQFGDGEGACGRTVEHVYDEPGSYGVRLRAIGSSGRVSWRASQVSVDGEDADLDSVEYYEDRVDSFVCNGDDGPNSEEGETELYQGDDGDWQCR